MNSADLCQSVSVLNRFEDFEMSVELVDQARCKYSDPYSLSNFKNKLNLLLQFHENDVLLMPQDHIHLVMYLRNKVYLLGVNMHPGRATMTRDCVEFSGGRGDDTDTRNSLFSCVGDSILQLIQDSIKPNITAVAPTQPPMCMPIVRNYVMSWRRFAVVVMNMRIVFSPLASISKRPECTYIHPECVESKAISLWETIVLSDDVRSLLTEQVELGFKQLRQDHCAETACLLQELKDELLMLSTDDLYAEIIEKTYINTMTSLNEAAFTALIDKGDLTAYALRVLQCMQTELERARPFIKSTEHVCQYIVSTLVDKQLEHIFTPTFDDLFVSSVDDCDALQKLNHIYRMISLSPNTGMHMMQEKLTELMVADTQKNLETMLATIHMNSHGHSRVIFTLMQLIDSYANIIYSAFDENKLLMRSVEMAMIRVFSSLESYRVNKYTLARQLAYIQHIMLSRKALVAGQAVADEFEMLLHDADSISYFLTLLDPESGEVFIQTYRQYLALRLLTASYDASEENLSLDQMRFTQYNPTIALCRGMIREVRTNRIHIATFNVRIPTHVRVVGRHTWAAEANNSVTLPPELAPEIIDALDFSHQSRPYHCIRLSPHLSTGTVALQHKNDTEKNRVVLLLSLVQLCIALMFNQTRTWRVCDIMEKLNITLACCRANLDPLIRASIFTSTHTDAASSDGALTSESDICIGDVSKIAGPRLNLALNISSDTMMSMSGLSGNIDPPNKQKSSLSSRAIDARIVHYLKSRSATSYGNILRHLNHGPTCELVPHARCKSSLERLCERGFIERDTFSGMYSFSN